ncbi:type I pullulanase [Cytobacillus sp. S13-E01]|uniref:type I pullulanase n=1 Tax=Cytobacillus sp. S13-E01 TaxID=3031326 RepID=UPI0023D8658F|nr:type I pullulanase [Cytobacillus sp. S13-E01]MDF0727033.1 type I pullulanase [Cytobacillus sp. S13-E01]
MSTRFRKYRKNISLVLSIMMIFSIFTSAIPQPGFAIENTTAMTVDGNKDDWSNETPLATSPEAGFEGFNIDNLYLKNDGQYLYFWVDAVNVPNWGENGQFLNIALQVNAKNSNVAGNPWGAQYNFNGTENKPQYHITFRVKNDNEVNGAALYSTNDLSTPLLNSWEDSKGAEFAVDRATGFEGKIPLSELNLKNNDELKAIVVLSGNNGEHGAFDVIPQAEGNQIAASSNESANPNIQSTYSTGYKVTGITAPQALAVSNTTPVNGEKNVSTQPTITIAFNETIQLASDHKIKLTDSSVNPINIIAVASDKTLTLTPDKLSYGETYTVEVPSQAVTGLLTNTNLSENLSFSFSTRLVDSPVVTETVTFNYQGSETTQTANVAGEFNNWTPEPMVKGVNNIYSLSKNLPSGVYGYKFVVDGNWIVDPLNSQKLEDGNNKLVVPGLTANLPTEMEIGEQRTLTAKFLNKQGEEVAATPIWSIKEPVSGVELSQNQLTITADAPVNSTFTLQGEYEGYTVSQTIKILAVMFDFTINYYRFDGKQNEWDMWVWDDNTEGKVYPFTSTTEDGFAQTTFKFPASKISVITRPGSWSTQEVTRQIQLPEGQDSVEAWMIEGVEEVYYNKDQVDTGKRIQAAMMDSLDKVLVTTTHGIEDSELTSFTLTDVTNETELEVSATRVKTNQIQLTVIDPSVIDVRNLYEVKSTNFTASKVTMRKILDDTKFQYDGKDLGLTYSSTSSTFKLWAPTATKVSASIYDNAGTYNQAGLVEDNTNGLETEMTRSANGVWSTTINEDLNNKYYMYKVEFADGKTNYAVDPYAFAVSANGQRSAIIDLNSSNPSNWNPTSKPAMVNPTDAIVYELQVRDFSIDENSGMTNKGKFKAFTEEGTTDQYGNATGIDHLADLGVTNVHLLPSYDFKTVNELTVDDANSVNAKYNWGYDPQNYNVPEGSYSTDPENPITRITEFKEMVQAMHDNNIRVVMDVVYNHTFDVPNGPFDKVVPGYFYRTTETGKLANGSGVGNEIATERPMVRKYIKDSVRYWAEEYNVDGFRFDLMGLIDVNTIEQLTKELQEQVDPTILIYGEPWQAGGSPLAANLQTLKGSQKDKNFAVFNDNFRGAIKGGSDDASKGFATGEAGKEADIVKGVMGGINDFTNRASETINYVTAHDNLNLWDKIIKTQGLEEEEGFVSMLDGALQGESAEKYASVEEAVNASTPYHAVDTNNVLANETVKRSLLANGIILTSQGIPFIHAGDELLRTKFGDHNSYKSPDAINQIRWDKKEDFKPVFDYYKGLIELRKTHPAFRMSSKEAIANNLEVYKQDGNIVAFKLKNNANNDRWKNIVVIYNGNAEAQDVALPSDSAAWNVVVDDTAAGTETLRTIEGNTASVAGLSTMVLYDVATSYTPVVTTIDVSPTELGLEVDEVRTIRAVVKDQNGSPVTTETITWASSDSTIATVSSNGKITAIANGTATITATIGSVQAIVTVNVGELIPTSIELSGSDSVFKGLSTLLTAVVKDQFGQVMTNPIITWTSSKPAVATVKTNGEVTGVAPGITTITVQSGEVKAAKEIEVKEYVQRYIQFTYVRADKDYEGWNMWTWQTGVEDGQKLFDEVTDKGAVATFEIGPETSSVGFVLRKGQNWDQKDPYDADRYITIDPNQPLTKVVVTSGVKDFHTVSTVNGPVLDNGSLTFFYRDMDLYKANAMDTIENVQVKVNDEVFDMNYRAEDELFNYTMNDLQEGTYDYSFLVTINGITTEVTDPFNTNEAGKSIIEFKIPDLTIESEVTPSAISAKENAVVKLTISSEDNVEIKEAYLDLSPLGGAEKVVIDPELYKQTIAVTDSITAGTKDLTVTVVDEFGNKHTNTVAVEVKAKQSVGKSDFDWDEARIYFMLTDRFNDGDPTNNDPNGANYDTTQAEAYHGGDFQGIIDKLDYIEDLGINTIWITPIVDNIDWDLRNNKVGSQFGYHGYWSQDFTSLDEHLGDIETFKKLIDKAHDRGIKIMVDVVLNHAGYGLKENDPSIGMGIENFPTDTDRERFTGMLRDGGTDSIKGELAGLPDFKTEDQAVRQQVIEWQTAWLEKARTNRGDTIDYFRVDTVKNVEDTTWKAFKNALTEIKPDFKLIGEYFGASVDNTGGNLRSGQMDSLLDFGFKGAAQNFINGDIDGADRYLQYRNSMIDNTATLGQFLSSHDEDGFLVARADGDINKMKLAAALQITAKGQPVIYYGEELGQSGRTAGNMDNGEFSENRYDFAWDQVENNEMLEHYQKLLNIRKDFSKVFSKGTREKLAGGNDDGYLVFERSYNNESVVVGLNTTTEAKTTTFEVPFEAGKKIIDLYSGEKYKVSAANEVTLTLPSRENGGTIILAAAKKEDNNNSPVGPTPPTPSTNQGELEVDEKTGKVKLKVTEEKINALIQDKTKSEVVIDLGKATEGKKVSEQTAELTKTTITKLVENKKTLVIHSGQSKVTLSTKNLTDIVEKANGSISITINTRQSTDSLPVTLTSQELVSNVVDFTVKGDNEIVSQFAEPIEVSITVYENKMKDKRKAAAYYLNETTNKWEYVGGKVVDAEFVFTTKHFSTFAVIENNKTFKDINNYWAKDEIEVLASRMIIQGKTATSFKPTDDITRAEFAVLLVRALNIPLSEYEGTFNDVSMQQALSAQQIEAANRVGIVNGQGNGIFEPSKNITREEMAAMIIRAVEYRNNKLVKENQGTLKFKDSDSIGAFAKEYVALATELGIIKGLEDNTFAPKADTTRAQASVMLYRLLEKIEEV